MATTASLFAPPSGLSLRGRVIDRRIGKVRRPHSIMAQQQQQQLEQEQQQENQATLPEERRQQQQPKGQPEMESLPRQPMAKHRNMSREYGGQWLSSVTRHVRIYAAYIDPITHAFDQTQMDKLTLILDPSNEFVWTNETCQKVYAYFQELVDHYEVIN
ncbi:NAD(P)H-quinone oxidoreductase subunit M, chloroplastic [Elaeis guineensis]|uniref:NAD(P)H-quinone oxidoreductase subunit M, chloroplastic n=1 Tax=Elaeis guineensis var. tenera TaxID=51953 RepID=UPI003C6D7E49